MIRRIRDLFNVYSRFVSSWSGLWREFEEVCKVFGLKPREALDCSVWLEEKNGGLYIRVRTPTKTLSKYVRKEKRSLAEKLITLKNSLRYFHRTKSYIEDEIKHIETRIELLIGTIKDELG